MTLDIVHKVLPRSPDLLQQRKAWMLHAQCQDDANVKTGDSRTMQARTTLARILKDSAFVTSLPIAQRLCPCALAIAALSGLSLASQPHQCLHLQGV